MDQSRPDLQRGALKGSPRSLLANLANLWQSPAARLSFLGVVALAFTALQLAAVWPDEHHWAKLSPSFAELEGRGEVPYEWPQYIYEKNQPQIPNNEDYEDYILKYDLWNVKERFCYYTQGTKHSGGGSASDPDYTVDSDGSIRTGCHAFTTAIKRWDGGEACRGRGIQCEDHFAATSTARTTTCVALICAAVVGLGFLFVCNRARRLGRGLEASPKAIFGAAAVLAVGGVVGLAGAANYRSTMAADVNCRDICDWGCALSLYAGVGAMVLGAAVAASEVRSNAEELRRWSCIDSYVKDIPSPDAPALKKAFVRLGLLGLLCTGAQVISRR